MESAPYLIFAFHGSLYAAKAASVREILWLPGLTPVEESPPHIIGVFNLRGKIIPVMDLKYRFGHAAGPYRPSDVVIVLEADGSATGVIANEIAGIRDLSGEDSEERPAFLKDNRAGEKFIGGVAKVEDSIVMLLNLSNLVRCADMPDEEPHVESAAHPVFKDAAQEEMKVFKERAHNYRQPTVEPELSELIPLAVVALSGEYFGVGLEPVREFSDINNLKPVPCCPEHILGNINLRGNVVTLVDIRSVLGIPATGQTGLAKAIILSSGELPIGVAVEDVIEIVYLRKHDMAPMPAAPLAEKYAKGTVRYANRMLTLLDLPMILASDDIIVDEQV